MSSWSKSVRLDSLLMKSLKSASRLYFLQLPFPLVSSQWFQHGHHTSRAYTVPIFGSCLISRQRRFCLMTCCSTSGDCGNKCCISSFPFHLRIRVSGTLSPVLECTHGLSLLMEHFQLFLKFRKPMVRRWYHLLGCLCTCSKRPTTLAAAWWMESGAHWTPSLLVCVRFGTRTERLWLSSHCLLVTLSGALSCLNRVRCRSWV